MDTDEFFKYVLFLSFILIVFYIFYIKDKKFQDFDKKSWYGKLLAFRIYFLLFLGLVISLYKIFKELLKIKF